MDSKGKEAYEKLKSHKKAVDLKLEEFIDKKISFAQKFGDVAEELANGIKEYNLRGGKRIRPALVIEGYKCFKDSDLDSVLDAALSIELAEAYLLMHDDVMDNDAYRRGGPSLHKVFEKKITHPASMKYGESMAIVGGDITAIYACDAILESSFSSDIKIKALKMYDEILSTVCYGQQLDIYYGYVPKASIEDVLKVFRLKTAAYTIEGPLQLGAVLAGASDSDIAKMSEYGIPVGQAFQIQDDILGMFGDEKKLGKPSDSDLKEGKRTLLILKALEKASSSEKEEIEKALGNPQATPEQVNRVREIIKSTGSLEYSKSLAIELANKGKKAISETSFREEGKEFLIGIADYLIDREF